VSQKHSFSPDDGPIVTRNR